MKNPNGTSFDDYVAERLKDEKFKKEYDALEEEYQTDDLNIFNMEKSEIIELSKRLPGVPTTQVIRFNSVLIIPTENKHDSGFNCMLVIGCKDTRAICKITDWSDDLMFKVLDDDTLWRHVRIDCLAGGILRLWGKEIEIKNGCICSSVDFDVKNR